MRPWIPFLCALFLLPAPLATAESSRLLFPDHVVAGTEFSVPTSGSGEATLYLVGPADVLARKVQLGQPVRFAAGELHSAGHYIALLRSGSSDESTQFDVTASPQPSKISFLAKPSRLPVNLPNAVSGVAYIFDVYGNLVLRPQSVVFELSDATGHKQSRTVSSHEGVAWVKMNSAAKAGVATLQSDAAGVREKRVIQQVPGDPCAIRMTAHPASKQRVALETEPVRDCNGNPVPDGTIVTFTEVGGGVQSTVDVPLKRGVARTELPAQKDAVISVAAGVVMGNEIRWNGGGE